MHTLQEILADAILNRKTAKEELQNYMAMITKEGEDYIPSEDRIAVFDLDGTLFCETDPNYFDRCRRRLVTSVMS